MKNVVIAGGGNVGLFLARTLSEEGHNITVIEKDESKAGKFAPMDVLVVVGNAASPSVLNKAYIGSADFFIAVTEVDEVNIASCALAKKFGCRTIARINGEDYIQEPVSLVDLKDVGIDVALCPELITSAYMANVLSVPLLLDSPLFERRILQVMETRVDRASKAVGQEVKRLDLPREVNLVAVFRNEEVLIPKGSLKLQANDRVIFIMAVEAEKKVSEHIARLFGVTRRAETGNVIRKVMIAGGSRIGYHLARLLSEKDMAVILIEEDEKRCQEISQRLPDILVVNAQPTDREMLREEGITEADVFLAVTDKDEVNILTALMARQIGARKAIGLVDRPALKSILEEIGIDLVISPRSVALSTILKYFHEEDMDTLGSMNQGQAQVVEVRVKERSRAANKRIDSLMRFRGKDLIIGAIIRGDKVLIPRGDTMIHPKDKLVIFTKSAGIKWIMDHF